MPSISWQLATVQAIREENPTVKTYTLALPHWAPFLPGQHYDLRLTAPDGYQAQRSYSIASSSTQTGTINLTIEQLEDGEISSFMHEVVVVGDQLEVRGPIGGYFVWQPELTQPLLLIAGGSGVVPLMAMIRHRAALGITIPTTLLFSIRSPQQVIYGEELAFLQQQDEGLQVVLTYTRSTPENWTGYRQRIDQSMLQEILHTYQEVPLTYICGSTTFVENAASMLVALGVPASSILTERFGPTGGNS